MFTRRANITYHQERMQVQCRTLLLLVLMSKGLHCNEEVEVSIETVGYPSFYKDEPITLTCTASEEISCSAIYLVNGYSLSNPWTACSYDAIEQEWLSTNILNIPGISTINSAHCNDAAAAAPPFIISVPGTVTNDMLGANFKCFADTTPPVSRFNSTPVSISRIDVKPRNIKLNSPSHVVEEKEFTFSCRSTGGSPASVYVYEVLRGDDVVVSGNTYTPVKDDREGLTLRCKDTAHAVLEDAYPDLILASKKVRPQHLDYEELLTVLIHNTTASLTLSCPVSGHPTPSYSWTCSKGCSITSTDQLFIPANSRENGQVETISCTAFVKFLSPATVTFNIRWKGATSLLPTSLKTTPTTEDQTISLAVVPGIVAGILGIALVTQTVIVCWWKRRTGMNGKDKNCEGTSQSSGSTSHGHQNHPFTTDQKGDNYESLVLQRTEDHPYSSVTLDQPYETMERRQHVFNTAR